MVYENSKQRYFAQSNLFLLVLFLISLFGYLAFISIQYINIDFNVFKIFLNNNFIFPLAIVSGIVLYVINNLKFVKSNTEDYLYDLSNNKSIELCTNLFMLLWSVVLIGGFFIARDFITITLQAIMILMNIFYLIFYKGIKDE